MTAKIQRVESGKPVLLTIADRFLSSPVAKLKPGSIIYGEVTQLLDKNKILLKLLNREIIAKTNFPVAQGEKLKLWIKKQGLPIILEVLGKPAQKLGVKSFLPVLLLLSKFAFNPLSNDPVKEFKKFVESKNFLKQLLDLISRNPELREKILKALTRLLREENYFYIPICLLDKNIIVKGKVSGKGKSGAREVDNFYFSIDTINLGTIEVKLTVLPVLLEGGKRINISFFTSTQQVATYIESRLPDFTKAISDVGLIPGRFTVSVPIHRDETFFIDEEIGVLA